MRHEDVGINFRIATLPTVFCLILAALVQAPLGSAAMPDDYARFDAAPSWYTLPAHGLLVVFDQIAPGLGWVGAMVLPLLAGFFLIGIAATEADLRTARIGMSAMAVIFGLPTLTVLNRAAPLIGTRDPAGDAVPNAPVAAPDVQNASLAAKGRTAFNAGPCAGCHGKDGVGTPGGPSLIRSHVRHPEAEYYIKYITNPKSVKPTSTMPAFPNTKKEELDAIAEFLRFPISTAMN
jgi:mono/diheme cytochrome c family protein